MNRRNREDGKFAVRWSLALSIVAGCVWAIAPVSPARAALVEADASSAVQTTYDANILTNDLINNGSSALSGAPVTTGAVATYGGDVPPSNNFDHLTDGGASSKVTNNDLSKDAYFDGGAFATNPTITYKFNTAANPLGFTLTQIRSIAGWADTTSFSNQKYTVSISLVGSPTVFTQLASVNYAPFTGNGGTPNSSQVTLTDGTGSLASGVAAVQFAILNNGGSGQVFREIDVAGAPTAAPEPTSLGLLGVGGLLVLRRRRTA